MDNFFRYIKYCVRVHSVVLLLTKHIPANKKIPLSKFVFFAFLYSSTHVLIPVRRQHRRRALYWSFRVCYRCCYCCFFAVPRPALCRTAYVFTVRTLMKTTTSWARLKLADSFGHCIWCCCCCRRCWLKVLKSIMQLVKDVGVRFNQSVISILNVPLHYALTVIAFSCLFVVYQ